MTEKTPIRKSMLPNGPWTDEADELSWDHKGLACFITRSPWWNLNGYVGVDIDHPLYSLRHDEPSPKLTEAYEKIKKLTMDDPKIGLGQMIHALTGGDHEDGITPGVALAVHGGITWTNAECPDDPEERKNLWWFGFDTSHHLDYSPGLFYTSPNMEFFMKNNVYRDLEYVKREVESLADQLVAIQQVFN